jgi:DNA repair protein RAD16
MMLLQDPLEDSVVNIRGHVFCYQCVSEYLTGDDNACPASDCKEQLGSDVVFSEATLRRRISDNLDASSSNSAFDDTSISMSIVPQKSKLFLRFNPIVRLRVQFQDLMVLQDPVLVCYVDGIFKLVN